MAARVRKISSAHSAQFPANALRAGRRLRPECRLGAHFPDPPDRSDAVPGEVRRPVRRFRSQNMAGSRSSTPARQSVPHQKQRSGTSAFHPDQDQKHLILVSTKPGAVQKAWRDEASRRMVEARSGCFPTDAR